MSRLVGFGSNVAQNIDPENTSSHIKSPRDISVSVECHEVVWHSWEGTIARLPDGSFKTWGSMPNIDYMLDFRKIVGHDSPLGYLNNDQLHLFDGRVSVKALIDVTVTGLGDAFAVYDRAVYHFASISDLLQGKTDYSHSQHLFDSARLYAMESRCFIEAQNHLFEVTQNELRLIEELEGLGLSKITTGRRNRLGVITQAGDAYIFDTKAKEPVLLELEDTEEVRLMGLGSDFDVIVTESKVLTRGSNTFGQLGRGGTEDWAEIDVEASDVVDVHCGRWSTILTLDRPQSHRSRAPTDDERSAKHPRVG